MTTEKMVLGVFAGIVTGAVLGILFAPAKGSETRKNISKKGENLIEDIHDKFDDLLELITEKIEKIKGEYSSSTEKNNSESSQV